MHQAVVDHHARREIAVLKIDLANTKEDMRDVRATLHKILWTAWGILATLLMKLLLLHS